ncbi:MAG: peptidase [Caulobacteraceae bacterium]|nr:peptidase [Caulobacteraceae bacterium]
MQRLFVVFSLLAACLAGAGPVFADEGMWTFDNFPSAAVASAYGVTIDKAWLDHVRLSAVRLTSGCSAAAVSGGGLVMTNHHCVVDCVQALSTSARDLVKDGFLTDGPAEERKCPGMQAEILVGITDVTDRVKPDAAVTAGRGRARDNAQAAVERDGCPDAARYRCQVIAFYRGGQYELYRYRIYDDVRLVFAPEFAMAFFGGDPDNFNFPRYDLDVSFLRLYEDGQPAATPDHLTWNPAAPRAGEPVFVAGNPGATERLLTVAQLETQRDVALPVAQLQRSELRGRMLQYMAQGPEQKRLAAAPLFGVENSFKVYSGRQITLGDAAFMDIKRRDEAALKRRVMNSASLRAEIGDPWSKIADAQAAYANLYLPYRQLEAGAGSLSELFVYARTLVRAAAERARPPGDRLPEYSDARLPLIRKDLLDDRPVDPELERLYLVFWLSKTREYLTADDPDAKALLGKESPEALAARLVEGSRLADPAVRRALWDGGQAAIAASDDPMIRFVRATDERARRVRGMWELQVAAPSDTATQRVAAARFAVYGRSTYPDATFSLRLTYGKVAGWTERGRAVDPYTRLAGLYERATGDDPYRLPPRWLAARERLDGATVLDLTTTNDIIGGNSGSPLINARGQVVGAVFDGNIHSVGGDYGYDGARNRTIAVSTAAISEALDKVYGRKQLLAELAGK